MRKSFACSILIAGTIAVPIAKRGPQVDDDFELAQLEAQAKAQALPQYAFNWKPSDDNDDDDADFDPFGDLPELSSDDSIEEAGSTD